MEFFISIEAGTAIYGEIHTATGFNISDPLDAAGNFSFECPATDPNRLLASIKREAWCYAVLAGTVTNVGSGIIDVIEKTTDTQGNYTGMVRFSGPNMLGELNNINVGTTAISASTTGYFTLGALTPAPPAPTWSYPTSTTKTITHTYADETLLAAFIFLAAEDGGHIFAGAGRAIQAAVGTYGHKSGSTTVDARLFYNTAPDTTIPSNYGIITSMKKTLDSADCLVGRYYPYGSGFGVDRIKLASGTVVPAYMASAGYTRGTDGTKGRYLQHDATWASYAIERVVTFSDRDTSAGLLEEAFEQMDRQLTVPEEYDIKITGLEKMLHPMDTVFISAHEYVNGVDMLGMEGNYLVLEVQNRIDNQGARTVEIKCGTTDRTAWTDLSALRHMGKNIDVMKKYG